VKKGIVYISLLLMVIGIGCNTSKPKTDWSRYYESQYKAPFGTYVFRKELESIFSSSEVHNINGNTADYLIDEYFTNSTYFYINKRSFYLDSNTLAELLDFMMYDNGIFISTNSFDNAFFNTYDIQTQAIEQNTSNLTLEVQNRTKHFEINNRETTIRYFSNYPSSAKILGTVEVDGRLQPNFISYSFGGTNAQILLHCNPAYFVNYHMLNEDDGLYALNTLNSVVHSDGFIWDGLRTRQRYFEVPHEGGMSELFSYVLNNKSLLYSFLTMLTGVVLLLLFNYKRITRQIPIFKKQDNNSVAFIKTIANLFMNQNNHIDLARYRVNFILDRIRMKHHLNTTNLDLDFKERLAQKLGVNTNNIEVFISTIEGVRTSDHMNRKDFIAFNVIIERNIKKLNLYE
jgi:hypothetical protein